MSQDGPIGIFVHHQGRGHAVRDAAIANALAGKRDVHLFSARDDIFPPLGDHVTVRLIPSLFEPAGAEPPSLAAAPAPDIFHCAPLGWASIRESMAILSTWFHDFGPALFITDVSAELGVLARLCSVPHVAVLQHGNRSDPGHTAAYLSAVGLLAPFAELLEQPERPDSLRRKTHYAPGLGIDAIAMPSKRAARQLLGIKDDLDLVLVLAGGGGQGTPTAPLTLGARAEPDTRWVVIGETFSEWHETPPGNLELKGWVHDAPVWIAAADRVVSSCGNTTVHQIAATDKPWIVVPEWRYFAEQYSKADALGRSNICAVSQVWPSQASEWSLLWCEAKKFDIANRKALVCADAADKTAEWLDRLADRLWQGASEPKRILGKIVP